MANGWVISVRVKGGERTFTINYVSITLLTEEN